MHKINSHKGSSDRYDHTDPTDHTNHITSINCLICFIETANPHEGVT